MGTLRYTYRLRPGAAALAELKAEWGRSRWLWNEAVHMQRSGQRPTFKKLSKLLTELRACIPWMAAGSRVAQNQTLRTYEKALHDSFTVPGRGRPKRKKLKGSLPSLQYTTSNFRLRGNRLYLPHGISIPMVWSRPLPSPPTSVRVYQDSLGHWHASFVVRRDSESAPESTGEVGIDWGITTTATATDSQYDLPFAGHRKRSQAELAKSQRKMSRRRRAKGQTPSKGYLKARLATARTHKKVARQAKHAAIQWAKTLVQDHQLIAVEDFKPKFMFASKLARKAADARIGVVKRTLLELAQQAGRTVVLVSPAYTTQTCAKCLVRAKRHVERSDTMFCCDNPPCKHKQGRDRNAAHVVLAFAEATQAGFNLASVEGVRQPAFIGAAA